MQRILDIDLDFFVRGVVYWPDQNARPDPEDHPVWAVDEAIEFLRERCRLERQVPGFVTENHGELFPLWRAAIENETLFPPFHVTHVDAHADLGLGDAGYVYLLTELIRLAPAERTRPKTGPTGLNDGNHLAFAVACRWIADLTYVYCDGGGSDELSLIMQGFDPRADRIQLSALTPNELDRIRHRGGSPAIEPLEPPVPYRSMRWDSFEADGPYDFVCLTRSPPYSPPTADLLFDAIYSTFISDLLGFPES
jgi:hypothetical protein